MAVKQANGGTAIVSGLITNPKSYLTSSALLSSTSSLKARLFDPNKLDRTTLGHFTGTSVNSTSFTTPSFTPADNSLLVVCVNVFQNAPISSVAASLAASGGGLTWTRSAFNESLETTFSTNDISAIFTATVTTGASMTFTVSCSGSTFFNYNLVVLNYTNYDTATPIGGTGSYADPTGVTPLSYNLNATPAPTSEVVSCAMADDGANTCVIVGTGWTSIYVDVNTLADGVSWGTEVKTSPSSAAVLWDKVQTTDVGGGVSSAAVEVRRAPLLASALLSASSALVANAVKAAVQATAVLAAGSTLKAYAPGLIAHWKLNETATDTVSVNSAVGGPSATWNTAPTWGAGKDGNAAYVTPSKTAAFTLDLSNKSMTIMMWLWIDDHLDNYVPFSLGDSATAHLALHFSATAGGPLRWTFWGLDLDTVVNLSPNTWYHIAGTFNAGNKFMETFIDTVSRASQTETANFTGNTNGWIGGLIAAGSSFLKGRVDDIRVYDQVLTQAQITNIFNATGGTAPGASAVLPAASNLSVNANQIWDSKAVLAATALLAADATEYNIAAATLPATSSLSANALKYINAAATLPCTSLLSANAQVYDLASAVLPLTSILTATTSIALRGAALLSGASDLSAATQLALVGRATFAASSSLSATGIESLIASATLGLSSNISALVSIRWPSSATLPLNSSLSVDAFVKGQVQAGATLPLTSTLSCSTIQLFAAQAALPLTSSLLADSIQRGQIFASAVLVPTSTLSVFASQRWVSQAVLPLTSSLLADSIQRGQLFTTAVLTPTAIVSCFASQLWLSQSTYALSSNLFGFGAQRWSSAASLTATSNLLSDTVQRWSARAQYDCASVLQAKANQQWLALATLLANSTIIASGDSFGASNIFPHLSLSSSLRADSTYVKLVRHWQRHLTAHGVVALPKQLRGAITRPNLTGEVS